MFLGPQPLDEHGKQDVGHGMVWAANGFRCGHPGCVGLQVVLCIPLKLLHVQHEPADGCHTLLLQRSHNSISLPSAPPLCFRFRPWEMRPGQYIAGTGPDGAPAFPQPDPQQEETMALPLR